MSTLREKFKTKVSINTQGESGRFANQCVSIADDYAIEFAEWVIDTDDKPVGEFTIKELLEIFKKEKAL